MIRLSWFLKIAVFRALFNLLKVAVVALAIMAVAWIFQLNTTRLIVDEFGIWQKNNPQVFGVLLGAALASFLGFTTQLVLDHRRRRQAIGRSAKLIRTDIDRILFKVRSLEWTLRSDIISSSEDRTRCLQMPLHRIDWMPNWFEHVAELGIVLSEIHLSRIHSIYSGARDIQTCLMNVDTEKLSQLVVDLLSNDSSRQLMEDLTLTSENLLEDLSYISVTGRGKDRFWAQMWQNLRFRYDYRLVKEEVEAEIVHVLSEKERMNLGEVLKHMNTWISVKEKRFQRRHRDRWDKIVFRVVSDSDRIKMAWNELWLAKEENREYSA
jgi:hypothetical protein